MLALFKTKRWLQFTPVIFFSGISMAVYAALLIPLFSRTMQDDLLAVPALIYTDARKTSLACQSMIGLGAGEILGSLANGKLNDKLGVRAYLWICVVEVTLAFIMLFWYNETNLFDLTSAVAVAFCWGLQDSGITNFFLCIAGFQFGGSNLPFSALRFVQALAIGTFALIESQVQTVEQVRIYFACIFSFSLVAWMIFFCCFELRDDKKKATKVSTEPVKVSAKPLEE
jgi:predicted MFS family arabinose efflux permease